MRNNHDHVATTHVDKLTGDISLQLQSIRTPEDRAEVMLKMTMVQVADLITEVRSGFVINEPYSKQDPVADLMFAAFAQRYFADAKRRLWDTMKPIVQNTIAAEERAVRVRFLGKLEESYTKIPPEDMPLVLAAIAEPNEWHGLTEREISLFQKHEKKIVEKLFDFLKLNMRSLILPEFREIINLIQQKKLTFENVYPNGDKIVMQMFYLQKAA